MLLYITINICTYATHTHNLPLIWYKLPRLALFHLLMSPDKVKCCPKHDR